MFVSFQPDPAAIRWRVRLQSPPARVFAFLATDEGRARFWAESAIESDGRVHFRFPNGLQYAGQVLAAEPSRLFQIRYLGDTTTTFELTESRDGGTELTLTDRGNTPEDRMEVTAGWASVLMALKAAVDHDVDLRNHDAARTWDQGYVEN